MESETSEIIVTENQAQEQTDIESLTGTLLSFGDSSVTELPFSGGSETEFELDEHIDELVDSQFPLLRENQTARNEKEVQEWLSSATGDETQMVLSLLSQPHQDFFNGFEKEDIEKAAAILMDAAKTPSQFDASAWAEAEREQEVPTGDFKTNFLKEIKERPVLPLMNCIKMYCNESDIDKSEHLYIKILQCAAQCVGEAEESSPKKRKPADINTLKNFQGGYFSDMYLQFTKLPKNKRPLVKAVEKYVSDEIAEAERKNNAVLFTRFTQIPEQVKRCNEQNRLGFSPEQVAKYGIFLQKAVNQEIICRCVDFLKHVGFSLVPDEVSEAEKINLSSNESVFSQGRSSQGSHHEETDSYYSQISQSQRSNDVIVEEPDIQDGDNAAQADAYYAHQSREILRVQLEGNDSPGSSQRSLSMYSDSQSPPQLSLPEMEPVGAHSEQYMHQAVLEDDEYVILNQDDMLLLLPGNDSQGSQSSSGSSYASGEPRRRRRRLE